MRKQEEITLQDRNGVSLTFRITEMAVWDLQLFVLKVGAQLVRSGILTEQFQDQSAMARAAIDAIQGGAFEKLGNIDPVALQALLADLIDCCEYKIDKSYTRMSKDNISTYVDDIVTLFKLEMAVVKLHFGFLLQELRSKFPISDTTKSKADSSKPAMFLKS